MPYQLNKLNSKLEPDFTLEVQDFSEYAQSIRDFDEAQNDVIAVLSKLRDGISLSGVADLDAASLKLVESFYACLGNDTSVDDDHTRIATAVQLVMGAEERRVRAMRRMLYIGDDDGRPRYQHEQVQRDIEMAYDDSNTPEQARQDVTTMFGKALSVDNGAYLTGLQRALETSDMTTPRRTIGNRILGIVKRQK